MDEIDQDYERAWKLMAAHDSGDDHRSASQQAAQTAARAIASLQSPAGSQPVLPVVPGVCAVRSFKLTVVLRPEDVAAIPVRDGQDRVTVALRADGEHTLTADLSTKSVRKAQQALRAMGPAGAVAIIQGKLGLDATIENAGLAAQPKTPKAAPAR